MSSLSDKYVFSQRGLKLKVALTTIEEQEHTVLKGTHHLFVKLEVNSKLSEWISHLRKKLIKCTKNRCYNISFS